RQALSESTSIKESSRCKGKGKKTRVEVACGNVEGQGRLDDPSAEVASLSGRNYMERVDRELSNHNAWATVEAKAGIAQYDDSSTRVLPLDAQIDGVRNSRGLRVHGGSQRMTTSSGGMKTKSGCRR
ncbi:unnamed protein product, partial [Dovyalis caffra]